jgi:glycerophosphoryl diester phosphodiesterase
MKENQVEIRNEPLLTQDCGPKDHALGKWPGRKQALNVITGLRGRIGSIVWFALVFELFRFLVLAPLGAVTLRVFLERWGRCSVGNFEVLAFLLSPPGLVALVAISAIALTSFYLQIGGLLLLLADQRATLGSTVTSLARHFFRLLGLGLRQFVILSALALPFLGAIAGVLGWLWSGRDLNGLLVLKPPVFWIGVVLSGCVGASYAAAAGYLQLQWLLAVPAVLLEPQTGAGEALRLSRQRTRGKLIPMLRLVLVWLAAVAVLSSVLMGGLRIGSDWLLDHVGVSLPVLLPVTAVVLILHTLVAVLLSAVNTASFASLQLVLYRELSGLALPNQESLPPPTGTLARLPGRWLVVSLSVAVLGTVGLVCSVVLARVRLEEHMEITAHRGGAAAAPENTVAAIRQAIADQADWAEIDVQRTADGAIVVLHDSDLVRVGRSPLRVSASTLAQIKSIDVGSCFGEKFRGERVPTLDELLVAADNKIRLNIELKPGGPSDVAPLVNAVLDSVKAAGITDRCRLCSQSYESLQLARRIQPGIPVGFIAGAQLGELSQLEVNFLMVAQRLATRSCVESAGVRGIEVHAWTINNPDALVPLLDRGVGNLITDDPAAMRRRLQEVERLSPAERLLLRARNWLAD